MLQILVVCGAGLGSSFACQMSVESVLQEIGVKASVDHSDISSAAGSRVDIIISGKNFESQFMRYDLPMDLIFLDRLVDKNEIKEKLVPVLESKGELK
ncbi:PTS ascorbate transporter subunit IIB [Gracilibacillus salitolerans]|uniref:PTS ascorbate transporter subunit IIB n=1 Tax=Gracilibacillus salitolerans TaxID=2663022 RepID=A0A5Q2TMA7_9BACI|nr:PTS sugar transporter subunit IIB [Gracilibacillus salitolerans]QGH36084.1 PTS ascorbate transporter subunit IIB [Gracilibacillus salitolerans]